MTAYLRFCRELAGIVLLCGVVFLGFILFLIALPFYVLCGMLVLAFEGATLLLALFLDVTLFRQIKERE